MTDQPGLFDLPAPPPQPAVTRRSGRGRNRETFVRSVVVDVVVADSRALREEALHRYDTAPSISPGGYEDLLDPREEIVDSSAGALRWRLEPTDGLWPLLETIRIDGVAHDAVDDGPGRVQVSWTVTVRITDAAALRELARSGCRSDDVTAREEIEASFAAAWTGWRTRSRRSPGITWTPARVEVAQGGWIASSSVSASAGRSPTTHRIGSCPDAAVALSTPIAASPTCPAPSTPRSRRAGVGRRASPRLISAPAPRYPALGVHTTDRAPDVSSLASGGYVCHTTRCKTNRPIARGRSEVPVQTTPPTAPPLSRFPVLRTGSMEEARDAVTRVYLPHELAPTAGSQDPLGMVLNAVEDKNFTVGFLTYGAGTRLSMPATENSYHVNLTTRGATFADREDGSRATTEARGSGVVLLPDQLNRVRWTPDAEQLILKIDRGTLDAHLADLLGRPVGAVVDFDFQFDLAGPRGQSLLASVEFLAAELDRPGGIAQMPLAREQLEAFVLSQLLAVVPHQFTDELAADAEPVPVRRLKPVVEHIEANAEMPLSPVELARVGSMSVRTLHASFQRAYGVSPMTYLRRVRLGHVRTDLTNSRNPAMRVTDVAMRWGFFHPSRFARQYKDRYGELPSETVRRCAPVPP